MFVILFEETYDIISKQTNNSVCTDITQIAWNQINGKLVYNYALIDTLKDSLY